MKSKRTDPSAIADAVLAVATNNELLAQCYSVFAPSAADRKRVNLGAVLFVYCCARFWSASQNDELVAVACANAGELVPVKLKHPDRFVRVGDYLVSQFEVAMLKPLLEEKFQQRIPIPDEALAHPERIHAAIHAAVQAYELQLATLVKAALLLRLEQFADTTKRTAISKDTGVTFTVLAGNFDEQVTGITILDTANDPQLATEQAMRSLRGSVILHNYFERIVAELDAL